MRDSIPARRGVGGLAFGLLRLCVAVRRQFAFGLTLYGLSMTGASLHVPRPSAGDGRTPTWQGVALPGHPERLEPERRPSELERALWAGLEPAGGAAAPARGRRGPAPSGG